MQWLGTLWEPNTVPCAGRCATQLETTGGGALGSQSCSRCSQCWAMQCWSTAPGCEGQRLHCLHHHLLHFSFQGLGASPDGSVKEKPSCSNQTEGKTHSPIVQHWAAPSPMPSPPHLHPSCPLSHPNQGSISSYTHTWAILLSHCRLLLLGMSTAVRKPLHKRE